MNAAVQGPASDAARQVQEAATQPVLIIGT